MFKHKILTCLLAIICFSCVGCNSNSKDDLSYTLMDIYLDELGIDNIFGTYYLRYSSTIIELDCQDIDNFDFEYTRVKNTDSLKEYGICHLLYDDSYYLINTGHYNHVDIIKMSQDQLDYMDFDDFDWYSGNLLD